VLAGGFDPLSVGTAILTEDLADGTVMADVRIVNPFGSGALSAAAEELLSVD